MPSSPRAKILLLIPHLGGGGAEHVVETLARHLDRDKYEIHLGLVTRSPGNVVDRAMFEDLHELNALTVRHSPLKIMWLIWNIRPSIVLSGMAHLNLPVLLLRPFLPRESSILVRQNGEFSATLAAAFHPVISRMLYKAAYRRADVVICQTEAMAKEIQRECDVEQTKTVVLPNPVDIALIRSTAAIVEHPPKDFRPRLLAIGRLVPEKGFDLLLEAVADLPIQFAATELIILGTGRCEAELKHTCRTLGIEDRVRFLGHVPDPAAYFPGASLFVLSSRTEGLPNALLEASAAGLPIVLTPASPGLTNLLRDKEGVWLTHEISANALRNTLAIALREIKPGQRYPHAWIDSFDHSRAIPAYEAVIDQALQERA